MTNEEAIEHLKKLKIGISFLNSMCGEKDKDKVDIEALDVAIRALSEPKITVFTENQTIRWTDKVSLKDNGDIVDFEGRVIGHINFEEGE